MRGMVHGQKSLTRQWCDGQLHQPLNHRTTGNPDGTPETTNPTHQCRQNNQRSRTDRTILQNDYPEQTPEAHYTLLRDKPRRRPNNIWLPLAANLQPPSRLGKRKGHHALAKGMGMAEEHHDHHNRTNTSGVPPTCQSIRRRRSQQIPTRTRRRPHDQPKGRCPSSLGLQNLPIIPRPRH